MYNATVGLAIETDETSEANQFGRLDVVARAENGSSLAGAQVVVSQAGQKGRVDSRLAPLPLTAHLDEDGTATIWVHQIWARPTAPLPIVNEFPVDLNVTIHGVTERVLLDKTHATVSLTVPDTPATTTTAPSTQQTDDAPGIGPLLVLALFGIASRKWTK